MWQELPEYVLSMNQQVRLKVFASLFVFLAAAIITRILRVFLSWRVQTVPRSDGEAGLPLSRLRVEAKGYRPELVR